MEIIHIHNRTTTRVTSAIEGKINKQWNNTQQQHQRQQEHDHQ